MIPVIDVREILKSPNKKEDQKNGILPLIIKYSAEIIAKQNKAPVRKNVCIVRQNYA